MLTSLFYCIGFFQPILDTYMFGIVLRVESYIWKYDLGHRVDQLFCFLDNEY